MEAERGQRASAGRIRGAEGMAVPVMTPALSEGEARGAESAPASPEAPAAEPAQAGSEEPRDAPDRAREERASDDEERHKP